MKSRGRLCFKRDGTRAETRFRLLVKRTSPFKSAGGGHQFSRLLAAKVRASAAVMLDTPCSVVVWRVLATHSIRQFPLHFPSRTSLCAITFQLDFTNVIHSITLCFKLSWHVNWVQLLTSGNSSMVIRYKNETMEGLTVEIVVSDRKYQVFQSDLQSI